MRKLLLILTSFFCLFITGCSDFWNWLEEEDDKTYIYTCIAGTMTESYYENNFTKLSGSSTLNYGFYEKTNSDFASRVEEMLASGNTNTTKTVNCYGERMSVIEPKLKAAGFASARISTVENKARTETEVLFINIDNYSWIYMKLTNVR